MPSMTKSGPSPFDLDQPEAYARWRQTKLAAYPGGVEELIVPVQDPRQLSSPEHEAILDRCRRANMAIYRSDLGANPDKDLVRALGAQFGLIHLDHNAGADEDAITSLKVREDEGHAGYIPYTNRPIAWHTDGYYNPSDRQIHGMVLHCVQPANRGGDNDLLDHEIVYLLLRDLDPAFIQALMHPEAMTIPAHLADGERIRQEQPGPVFQVRPDGRLHMRFTDRKRNIHWRQDPLTQEAVAALREILNGDLPQRFHARLESGWGLICNNVLHTRTGFDDDQPPRLLYRARYYDRMAGT